MDLTVEETKKSKTKKHLQIGLINFIKSTSNLIKKINQSVEKPFLRCTHRKIKLGKKKVSWTKQNRKPTSFLIHLIWIKMGM